MEFYPVSVILILFCFSFVSSAGSNVQAFINQTKLNQQSLLSYDQAFLKSDISINCGSVGTSAAGDGTEWIGDTHPKLNPLLQMIGTSTISSSTKSSVTDDQVIFETARIFHSPFFYTFHLSPGPKNLRLHFNANPYKGFTSFRDLFTVEAAQFTLLQNFGTSLTAQALNVSAFTKEYYISIQENQPLSIIFSPSISSSQDKTYAFINGIEIISVPANLSYFNGGGPETQVVRHKSLVNVDNSSALELIYRFNARLDSVLREEEFDTAVMLGTVTKKKAKVIKSLTWKCLVDVGFRYLVRIHFSDLGLKMAENDYPMFQVLVNEITVNANTDEVKERNQSQQYRDYVVVMKGQKHDGQRNLSISLQSVNDFMGVHGLLKGFEILKVSNADNSLASQNPPSPARSAPWISRMFLSVLGHRNAITPVVTIMILLVSIIVHKSRKLSVANHKEEENRPSARAERRCRNFSLSEIQSATRNFSDAFFIGRGGFGKVYKAVIDNREQTVAIKRLKPYSKQGRHEFLMEIETLSELRHINLVSLIGYCNECSEMILIYEYMTRGTLADHLYMHRRNSDHDSSLTWKQRLSICIGAGRGLEYLHTGHRIIHRDVKASNILLDENFIAKVADFGLAKPEDRNKLQSHVSTNVKGTLGYFDPHYIKTRKLTRKSDTYAFGVVLFEVLCGRPAADRMASEDERLLVDWARKRIHNEEVSEIVASNLKGEITPTSLDAFLEVALRCLHDDPKERPTMAQVVVQLEFALEQQEQTGISTPDQERRDFDKGLVGFQLESVYKDTQANRETPNHEPPAGNKDGRIKENNLSRLWPWDAIWNRAKPFKHKDSVSKALIKHWEAEIEVLKEFDFSSIAEATNHFSATNKMEYPFCTAYKAVLLTGQIFAVARIPMSSLTHRKELMQQILLLPKLQHSNILKVLGYCIHREEVMLVYEFIANRSLEIYINDKKKLEQLHWTLRFKIIMGVARGIAYLHQDSRMRLIHGEINPCTILLDSQMKPRITNFCLTKTSEPGQSGGKVHPGRDYIAPEINIDRKPSFMSDVYSFGLIMLAIISGEQVFSNYRELDLAQHARRLWSEGKALQLINKSIQGSYSAEEALRCIQVGLLCTQRQPMYRPTMPYVLKMLSGEETPPVAEIGGGCTPRVQ